MRSEAWGTARHSRGVVSRMLRRLFPVHSPPQGEYLAAVGITPARCPACLLYSLEARVRPRVEFLQQRGVPLPGGHNFLALPDSDFCRRYGRCEPTEYAAFLAEWQAARMAKQPRNVK